MNARFEVPQLDDLVGVGIAIEPSQQPGVVTLVASANDGDTVALTWDEIAGSVTCRWLDREEECLVLYRETASKVSVRDDHGSVQFRVWSRFEGLDGTLVVQVGEHVSLHDTLLRT